MSVIDHANIIYISNIHSIGGVETYAYELVKKYKDFDIAVVCKSIDPEQKKRLNKFCRVYIHTNQKINCKVAIINYDTSIIDYITEKIWKENAKEDEGIYQGIHADYTHPSQGQLPQDKRIKAYLAITEDILHNFSKLSNEKNVILCRNPLKLEEDEPFLILVSPTRLTEEKGGDLMLQLANTLDRLQIQCIWFVLTTEEYIDNPIFTNKNVIWIKNRLNVAPFINMASWVVLASKTEGDSYTLREALYRGIPIVARHLKYFDEIGIKENENALFIDENNIEEIAQKMLKPLKFKFEPIKDGYDKLMYKSKSRYEEELEMRYLVEALPIYQERAIIDNGLGRIPNVHEQWEVDKIRLDELLGLNEHKQVFVKVIKELKPVEKKIEKATIETKSKKKIEKK